MSQYGGSAAALYMLCNHDVTFIKPYHEFCNPSVLVNFLVREIVSSSVEPGIYERVINKLGIL